MTRQGATPRAASARPSGRRAVPAGEAPHTGRPRPAGIRLYALDCGRIDVKDMSMFSDTDEHAGERGELAVPCFLIRHPRGDLLWDTGLGDRVARSPDGVPYGGGVVRFHLARAGYVILSGDLFHTRENHEKMLVPPGNTSRAETLASADRIERLLRNYHARLIVQHDTGDFRSLPAFPGHRE